MQSPIVNTLLKSKYEGINREQKDYDTKMVNQPVLVRSLRYISSRLLPDEPLLSLSCRECRRAPTMPQCEI